MKRFLATTALTLALASPAFASPPEAEDKGYLNEGVTTKAQVEAKTDLSTVTDIDLPNIDLSDDSDVKDGFTDTHTWINKTVYDSDMNAVGEVERVKLDDAGMVTAIVVETGGALDIGGHEVLVSQDQYMKISTDDDQVDLQLTMTKTAFAELPAFDEDMATDYPLADDDLADGVDEPEEADSTVEIN